MKTLILDGTAISLQAALTTSAATTNPTFITNYADNSGSGITEGATDGVLNGSTDVTIVPAPSGANRRIIKNITIFNGDTAAVTVLIKYDNNATQRTLVKVTLAVGDTWTTEGVFDSNGNLKQTIGNVNLATGVTGTLPIANGGTGTTSTTFANLATNVTGTLPIVNGGTGTTSTTFANLATNVTGTLPIANGGTGTTSTTFASLTSNVTGTLPVGNGGTGQTTYTDGQLLIGNSTGNTLTKATLTAGSGISITNGSGAITITASGGGDVTGPASSTDNAVTRFDSTTGKLIQNSLVTIADDGAITAPAAASVIPFYYATQASFPSAATYHGAIAHSHADGAIYFAHAGSWVKILDGNTDVTVAQGGTGLSTLTANNVILGNGTSSVQFVAPSTAGNVLTSNGTTWTSSTPGASITAGKVIALSTIFGY